ncbi:MAG: hypothetical protein HQ527_05435 [Cyanobacteria bacterium]|nr:hypothetical protein [Cyanobacteria bacterium bin.51]
MITLHFFLVLGDLTSSGLLMGNDMEQTGCAEVALTMDLLGQMAKGGSGGADLSELLLSKIFLDLVKNSWVEYGDLQHLKKRLAKFKDVPSWVWLSELKSEHQNLFGAIVQESPALSGQ